MIPSILVRFGLLLVVVAALSILSLKGVKRLFDLSHAWWTHLPAAMTLWAGVVVGGIMTASGGLVYYVNNVNVVPGPWRFLGNLVGISVLLIGASIFIDELWARQETRKTFNWMSLFDETAVGIVVVASFASLNRAAHGSAGWAQIAGLLVIGCPVVVGIILELARPYVPREDLVQVEDTSALEAELTRRQAAGERITYWEAQNPAWMTALIVVTAAALAFGAATSYRQAPWLSFLLLVLGAGLFLIYGGLRVSVTEGLVEVRLGMLGIRLLTMPTNEIAEVSVHTFAPLKDFGGYGIRGNREMKAYFFRGNRGVLLRSTRGKKYLVGSDRPERLATVLRVVGGQQ